MHLQSSNHLITCTTLSHYIPILAYIVQQLYIDARYIARFNAFASHNCRFRLYEFCTNTFLYAIISATVYDQNLNCSIARIFFRFCSCANCDNGLNDKYENIVLFYIAKTNTIQYISIMQFKYEIV